jgi:hypothetical protein
MKKNLGIIAFLAVGWFYAGSALAVAPGNTLLLNTATLTYTGNESGISAVSIVTVNVVAANPILSDIGTLNKAENQTLSEQYSLTARNNGPDTYTLSNANSVITNAENIGTINYDSGATTTITLGATALQVTSVGAGAVITVPSDGAIGGAGSVNGLEAGDFVEINNIVYEIAAAGVVDSQVVGGTATITLTTNIENGLDPGTGVYERKTFNITSTDIGDRVDVALAASFVVTTTATSGINAGNSASDAIQINIFRITITKYVRNTSAANCTGGTGCDAVDIGGVKYHLTTVASGSTVTVEPGNVLQYLIRVVTPAEAGVANAIISDVLDDFTTYSAGTTTLNTAAVTDGAGTIKFPLSIAQNAGLLLDSDGTFTGEGDGIVALNTTVDVLYTVNVSAL